jgi:hypothetical protein
MGIMLANAERLAMAGHGRRDRAAAADRLSGWAEANVVITEGSFRARTTGRCFRISTRSCARCRRPIRAASSR